MSIQCHSSKIPTKFFSLLLIIWLRRYAVVAFHIGTTCFQSLTYFSCEAIFFASVMSDSKQQVKNIIIVNMYILYYLISLLFLQFSFSLTTFLLLNSQNQVFLNSFVCFGICSIFSLGVGFCLFQ